VAVAEWLEMLATVSKVLGLIPCEVIKIFPECLRLVSLLAYVWATLSTGTTRAAYGNVLTQ
jgi:hypothetical protein